MERTDIKMPKNIFSHGVSQNDKTLSIQSHSMSLRKKSGWVNIKRFGVSLSCSYFKNWSQNRQKEKTGASMAS